MLSDLGLVSSENLNFPLWNKTVFVCSVTVLKPLAFFGSHSGIVVYGCQCEPNQCRWQFCISLTFGVRGSAIAWVPFTQQDDVGNWAEWRASGSLPPPPPASGRWHKIWPSALLTNTLSLFHLSVRVKAVWMLSHSQVFARHYCVPRYVPEGSIWQCIHDPELLAHGAAQRDVNNRTERGMELSW